MHGTEAAEVILQLESSSVICSAMSTVPNISVDGTLFIKEARSAKTVVAFKVLATREETASYTPNIASAIGPTLGQAFVLATMKDRLMKSLAINMESYVIEKMGRN